jgi:alkylated DNA repair dioxygenase AlkB
MWNGRQLQGQRFGEDSIFIKNFVRECGIDSGEMFAHMIDEMPWIDRKNKFMAYRGRPIKRTKFFLTRWRTPVHVYKYTGITWESTLHYKGVKHYPRMRELLRMINKNLVLPSGKPKFNHTIGTLYENGGDQIGFHSDKTESWTPGSSVAIISFGAAREFHMKNISDESTQVFNCEDGDLFILGWKDNQTHKHSIPETEQVVGQRISLCFRNISDRYTREELEKEVAKSKRAKERRLLAKVAKVEKSS